MKLPGDCLGEGRAPQQTDASASATNTDPASRSSCVCPEMIQYTMQVAELLMGVPAPVVYWEQGHEWVFGDPIRFQVCLTRIIWTATVMQMA